MFDSVRHGERRRARLVALVLGATLGIASPAWAQDPDMTDVDDVLAGQRLMIPADDLVAWWPTRPGGCLNNCPQRNYRISALLLDDGGATASGQSFTYGEHPTCGTTLDASVFPGPMQTRVARVFNVEGGEMLVTLLANRNATGRTCDGADNITLFIGDQTGTIATSSVLTATGDSLQLGVADFDGDGLDDLMVMNADEAFVASAADPSGASLDLVFGGSLSLNNNQTPQNEPAFGDLNADGIIDMAWIGGRRSDNATRSVHFASICPGDVDETICAGAERFEIILASLTRDLDSRYGNGRYDGLDADNPSVSVHIGNFDVDRVGDELVLLDNDIVDLDTNECTLRAFEVNATLSGAQQKSSLRVCTNSVQSNTAFPSNQLDGIVATSGPLVLFDDGVILSEEEAAHQMVVAHTIQNDSESDTHLSVISYGSDLTPTAHNAPVIKTNQLQIVLGAAVGRFSSPDDFGDSEQTTNQQIAVLRGSPGPAVLVYDIASSQDLKPALTTTISSALNFQESKNLQGNLLRVGDLQGRSLQLGEPEVVRVSSHTQPLVVVGAPPMHVDWIEGIGATEPKILNLTMVPRIYNASYTVDATMKSNSSTTNSTSYTYSKKKTGEAGASFEKAGVSVGASYQKSIERVHQDVVEDTYDTYQTLEFDASSETDLGDVVWFVSQRENIYNYPILGSAADDGSPQYVSFSVPDGIQTISPVDGSRLEWYQPIHEIGNILSYPWSFSQLIDRNPDLTAPLSEAVAFDTDDAPVTTQVQWENASGQEQSTGSTDTQSQSTSESASSSIGGGGEIDYSKSDAYSSLVSNSSTLGSSTGVEITKPETFREPVSDYQYRVEPYVFGEMLNQDASAPLPTPQADIQTTGPIRTTYVVDPRDANGGGAWWQSGQNPYLRFPDVAVHHPERWTVERAQRSSGEACLAASTDDYECAIFNEADQAEGDVWLTPFYWMRGFFITTTEANGDGPQLSSVQAGTDLFLQVRVYNYSFTEIPQGASTKVDFYRQPWDHTLNQPIGSSVKINGAPVDAGRIPPAQGENDFPNYVLVNHDLSTSDLGGTYQLFWVVVWIEDSSGSMVAEIPDHGLTEVPGTLDWVVNAPFEQHSNNIGVYNSAVHILGSGGESSVAATSGAVPLERELRVEDLELSADSVELGESIVVSAQIGATADVAGVEVLLAAIDRDGEREIFDHEILSYIAAGDTHNVRVLYRTELCGEQRIEVVARDTTHFLPAADGAQLEVRCEPTPTPTPISAGSEDDSCQVTRPARGATAWLVLAGAILLVFARSRSRRLAQPVIRARS